MSGQGNDHETIVAVRRTEKNEMPRPAAGAFRLLYASIMLRVVCVLASLTSLASVIAYPANLRPKQRVKLSVPSGETVWLVAETCTIARLFVTELKFKASALKLIKSDPGLTYKPAELATVEEVEPGSNCVYVSVLPSGPDGWVHESLLELTQEERQKVAESTAAANRRAAQQAISKAEREKPDPSKPLQLIDHSGEYNEFATYIIGRIRNNTNKTYSYVQVVFSLFDNAGNQVGSAMANVNNLESNGIWKFKAVGLAPAKRFKLSAITGF